jgi:hypothetical protein
VRVRGSERKKKETEELPRQREKRYRQKEVGAKFREVVTVQPVGALPHVPTTWEETRDWRGVGASILAPKLGNLKQ